MDAEKLKRFRVLRRNYLYNGMYHIPTTAEYKELSADVLGYISTVRDPLQKTLLQMYYYQAKSITAISLATNYSESQLKRIKKDMITHFG